ncbi:PE-PPE domain-containing protein [Mycobacterium sp. OTB74]|uniref:PE-PPE domain-containing protein n=1 Tax=Mycobacterium sp. OTB74 TaxID=1853452 RepID=UPI0024733CB9|nr:PE-PPE domain-containing protein [Mycobacterium sp. OTB74]
MSCTSALVATSTTSTTPKLLTNVLVMDGTTFSTPAPGFVTAAIDDFVSPALGGGTFTGVPVTTPEQVIDINESITEGLVALQKAMAQQAASAPGQPYVIFGYSQSTVIIDLEKIALAKQQAAGQPIPQVTFVEIGDGERPNGSVAERLSGLTIPFFDFTMNGAEPTDTGIATVDIARRYDGLSDAPEYPIDVVSDVNALLGIIFEHALYGEEVSLDPSSPNYVAGTTAQQHGDTTYYFIPTTTLPLLEPLQRLGIPQSVLNIVQPVLSVLVEAGYDRATPFWVPEPAQLIPITDPITFAIELANAVVQGAQNAASLLGLKLPGYTQLTGALATAQSQVAAAIGAPYRTLVSTLNTVFNPIWAFDHVEGVVANVVDSVINATGIPRLLNAVLDATLFPLTAWAERTFAFPQKAAAAPTSATSLASTTAQAARATHPSPSAPSPDPAVARHADNGRSSASHTATASTTAAQVSDSHSQSANAKKAGKKGSSSQSRRSTKSH